jgi:predicted flap endonuclease-1-like 5' DNA nuclease
MTMLLGQMLGCLLVAAGIGGITAWLLQRLSVNELRQQLSDLVSAVQVKEQALELAQLEFEATASTAQLYENKFTSSDALARSAQQELASCNARLHAAQAELRVAAERRSDMESELVACRSQVKDNEAATVVQAEELLQSHAALELTQQALARKAEELSPLHERIAALEQRPSETARLQARIQELEPAQGRVHWLEVQLSERETQHRTVLHEVERQLADRDRRIGEIEQLHQSDSAPSQHTGSDLDELQPERLAHEQRLKEKDEHIAALQQRIDSVESVQRALAGQSKMVNEQEEEISRLRKRLVEVQAVLRIRTDGGAVPRPIQPAGDQLTLQIVQPVPSGSPEKDDLSEIRGIGPAFERALNNMGIVTFRQIAQWDATNLKQIADQLDTLPERITRDQWIARSRKLHEQKYGKEL